MSEINYKLLNRFLSINTRQLLIDLSWNNLIGHKCEGRGQKKV